jgi:hypothetical protein
MIEILVTVAIFLGVGGLFARDFYRVKKRSKIVEVARKKCLRETFLVELEEHGTTEDRKRVRAIRDLDKEIELRLIESEQISEILDNEHIRDKLESAAVDVEELKLILSGGDDELNGKFKRLENNIDGLKLLNK